MITERMIVMRMAVMIMYVRMPVVVVRRRIMRVCNCGADRGHRSTKSARPFTHSNRSPIATIIP